jgi:hypothetical protein
MAIPDGRLVGDQVAFNVVFTNRHSRSGVNEGLNVLFSDLVKHLLLIGVPVRIYTTQRHEKGLVDILRANNVDPERVEILTPVRGSFALAILMSGSERKRTGRLKNAIWKKVAPFLSSRNWAKFLAWLLDFSVLTSLPKLLLLMLIAPFAMLFAAAALVALKVSRWVGKFLKFAKGIYILGAVQAASAKEVESGAAGQDATSSGSLVARFKRNLVIETAEGLYSVECRRLGTALAHVDDARTFFFFHSFSGNAVKSLAGHKKTMVVFPDAVASLYPTRYPAERFSAVLMASTVESVRSADAIICYSEFVKERELEKFLPVESAGKRVEVIPQGVFMPPVSLWREPLDVKSMNRYVCNAFPKEGALGTVQFGRFDYVFYPTVDRPHKGTMTAVRAVEYLLREKQRNVKLIITSHQLTEDVSDYVLERHLHRDILCMPALPIATLNKMLANAAVVVHPSLAEGGDIFNFSRAVSNGSPALLSDIQVVHEMFGRRGYPRERYGKWLFPAGDWRKLGALIEMCLADRKGVWQDQFDSLDALGSHGYEEMARQYLSVYESL